MSKSINLQKDYTTFEQYYQLKLPLEMDYMIPEDDSVRLLSQFIEEMNLEDLYKTYSRIRENTATPRQMLKILIYGYMNRLFSSRRIELACKRDINFMYLLEGKDAPDHTTIARFRKLHFAPCSENVMAKMSNLLYELGEITAEEIYIDGTKIEACANKYTFVWKRAVTKNLEKMLKKIVILVLKCEEEYGIKIVWTDKIKVKHLNKLRKELYKIKKDENVVFVQGKGKRKNPLQRSIEEVEEYIKRLKDYTKKINICGNRNSYSKTDTDATFMRMKEDHMKNGQLKAGYNIQHGVDSEYITWLTVCDKATDTPTLIPFLEKLNTKFDFKYKKIVADSGYESEENYAYIEKNNQLAYIKPSNYEISKTRKFKNDIGRIENMEYNNIEDYYLCQNGKKLLKTQTVTRKSKSGYKSEKTCYTCEDCTGCQYKSSCIKGNNSKKPLEERTKNLETSKLFNKMRRESYERISSLEGTKLRMNRSIQAEGSFGELKQDMGFRRFLSRGKPNVLAESTLLALAHNINKLHNKIQGDRLKNHYFELKESA